MGSAHITGQFENFRTKLQNIDSKNIFRKHLGEQAFIEFIPKYQELTERLDTVIDYAEHLSDQNLNVLLNPFSTIITQLSSLASQDDSNFLAQKSKVSNTYATQTTILNDNWAAILFIQLQKSGIIKSIATDNQIDLLDKKIQEVTNKMNQVEDSAKNVEATATNISLQDAQIQFNKASTVYRNRALLWGGISLVLLAGFIILVFYALDLNHFFPEDSTLSNFKDKKGNISQWAITYFSATKLLLLSANLTFILYSLKLLRSQLHLMEHNSLKKRLANSASSMIEMAGEDNKEYVIRSIIDSMTSFSNTGLIKETEEPTKNIALESVSKLFKSPGKQT